MKNGFWKSLVFLVASVYIFFGVLELDAFARAGSGRSFGSRGSRPSGSSRSYSTASPSQSKSDSGPSNTQPQPKNPQTDAPYQQPASGGFLRGLAGGLMGGLLGTMLFRSLGFADTGNGLASGIGFLEILLIAALLFGIYWYFKNRRTAAMVRNESSLASPPHDGNSIDGTYAYGDFRNPAGTGTEGPSGHFEKSGADAGIQYIRQMDSTFDEAVFRENCLDVFFKIQSGWANRDLEPIKALLTNEAYSRLLDDVDRLKREKRINRLENIAIRSADVAEAWQESGSDYITVRILANLLDYTVNESSGEIITGSKVDPVKFEECWTFVRPVGNHPWKLSAIQQS